MFTPALTQGMEKRDRRSGVRIDSSLLGSFGGVVRETDQAKILLGRGSASGFRDDVVHMHAQATILLRRQTISAALFVPLREQRT
jgi:hypothetical protein